MIISCPVCEARFHMDRQRLGGKRLTLKCSRCSGVFKIEVPRASSGSLVLVAHGDQHLCRAIGEILDRNGMPHSVAHDGDDALIKLDIEMPRVVLADVALPGLYAFQFVERVRQRPESCQPKVILLSSVYSRTAYKRAPSSLYGADDYLEKHHVADQLIPKILKLAGSDFDSQSAANISAPSVSATASQETTEPLVDELNQRIRGAEDREVEVSAEDRVMEKACRLARIIVSDIALYNQDLVDKGVRNGTFFDLLDSDVEEGRRLFRDRFGPDTGIEEDLLQQAFEDFISKRHRELMEIFG